MTNRRIKTLVVVAVAVTAGCSGFDLSGSDAGQPVTPAPVPTEGEAGYPPGLDTTGVTSPSLLGAAHGERVANTSYTLTTTRTVRYANGSLRSHIRVRVALDANRTHLANISVRGPAAPVLLGRPPATASFWSNGDSYLRRLVRDNQTVHNEYEPPDSYAGTWRYWVRTVALNGRPAADVTQALTPFHTRTARSQEADGTTYVVTGDRLREEPPAAWESRTNATLIARATETGLVRYYRTAYATTADGERVRVTRTVRFDAVGNTTVGPPSWANRTRSTPT